MTDTLHKSLRAAGMAFALLTAAAPMALADSPGYLFRDFEPQTAASSTPMRVSQPAFPQRMAAASAAPDAGVRDPQTSSATARLSPSRSGMN
jgi:hypothetical protein